MGLYIRDEVKTDCFQELFTLIFFFFLTCHSPVLYPGLDLDERQDSFEHLAGRARKHLQHFLLHNHFVHDCLEVAQGTDHLLLLLLQPADLLKRRIMKNTASQLNHKNADRENSKFTHKTTHFSLDHHNSQSALHVVWTCFVKSPKYDLKSDVACTHQQPIFPFVKSFTAGLLGNILITPKALGGSGEVHSGSGPVPFMSI